MKSLGIFAINVLSYQCLSFEIQHGSLDKEYKLKYNLKEDT